MIKVLLADVEHSGHHISYLRSILSRNNHEFSYSLCAPEKLIAAVTGIYFESIYALKNVIITKKSLFSEVKKFILILRMLIIAREKNINIFHLLYDISYLYLQR